MVYLTGNKFPVGGIFSLKRPAWRASTLTQYTVDKKASQTDFSFGRQKVDYRRTTANTNKWSSSIPYCNLFFFSQKSGEALTHRNKFRQFTKLLWFGIHWWLWRYFPKSTGNFRWSVSFWKLYLTGILCRSWKRIETSGGFEKVFTLTSKAYLFRIRYQKKWNCQVLENLGEQLKWKYIPNRNQEKRRY